MPKNVVRILLTHRITLAKKDLSKKLINLIKRDFRHQDPVYLRNKMQGVSTEGLTRYIRTWDQTDTKIHLWRGSLGELIRILKADKTPYRLIDKRLWLPRVDMRCSITAREYQQAPVDRMIKRQQMLLRAFCGSGKTEMMLLVAAHYSQPTLVLVWQERHQTNWLDRIPEYFGFEPGGIGGKFRKPVLDRPIVVGMVKSVLNRLDTLRDKFSVVICDEVDRFAARTLRECVNALPAAVRIGASDDERRSDGREFLLYDTFGPVGWRLKHNPECPVDFVLVPTSFTYDVEDLNMMFDRTPLLNKLVRDKQRNNLILRICTREVDAGHSVMIWSDRVAHCQWLKRKLVAAGYNAGLLIGGPKHKRECEATERGLRDGTVQVGIGTTVAEKSINLASLDRGIITCASANYRMSRVKQMRGRIARDAEGKRSVLYYLYDHKVPKLRQARRHITKLYRVKLMVHPID